MAVSKMSAFGLIFVVMSLAFCLASASSDCQGDDCPVIVLERASRRIDRQGSAKFVVRFSTTTGEEARVAWYSSFDSFVKLPGREAKSGSSVVASLVVPANVRQGPYYQCQIYTSKTRIDLNLDNSESTDREQTTFHVPRFNVTPSEIVYDAGQDVDVEIDHWTLHPYSPTFDFFDANFYLMNPKTNKLNSGRTPVGFWDVFGSFVYDSVTKVHSRLRTSKMQTSGVVDFYVGVGQPYDFIQRAFFTRRIVIRPSSKSGPFPSSFLDIVEAPGPVSPDGKTATFYCRTSVYESCGFGCSGAGNDLESVAIFSVGSDGRRRVLAVERALPGEFLTFVTTMVDNSVAGDVDLQCEARDAKGRTATKNFIGVIWEPTA